MHKATSVKDDTPHHGDQPEGQKAVARQAGKPPLARMQLHTDLLVFDQSTVVQGGKRRPQAVMPHSAVDAITASGEQPHCRARAWLYVNNQLVADPRQLEVTPSLQGRFAVHDKYGGGVYVGQYVKSPHIATVVVSAAEPGSCTAPYDHEPPHVHTLVTPNLTQKQQPQLKEELVRELERRIRKARRPDAVQRAPTRGRVILEVQDIAISTATLSRIVTLSIAAAWRTVFGRGVEDGAGSSSRAAAAAVQHAAAGLPAKNAASDSRMDSLRNRFEKAAVDSTRQALPPAAGSCKAPRSTLKPSTSAADQATAADAAGVPSLSAAVAAAVATLAAAPPSQARRSRRQTSNSTADQAPAAEPSAAVAAAAGALAAAAAAPPSRAQRSRRQTSNSTADQAPAAEPSAAVAATAAALTAAAAPPSRAQRSRRQTSNSTADQAPAAEPSAAVAATAAASHLSGTTASKPAAGAAGTSSADGGGSSSNTSCSRALAAAPPAAGRRGAKQQLAGASGVPPGAQLALSSSAVSGAPEEAAADAAAAGPSPSAAAAAFICPGVSPEGAFPRGFCVTSTVIIAWLLHGLPLGSFCVAVPAIVVLSEEDAAFLKHRPAGSASARTLLAAVKVQLAGQLHASSGCVEAVLTSVHHAPEQFHRLLEMQLAPKKDEVEEAYVFLSGQQLAQYLLQHYANLCVIGCSERDAAQQQPAESSNQQQPRPITLLLSLAQPPAPPQQ